MADNRKNKKIEENELDDSELDRISGGDEGFDKPQGGRCPLCGYYCFSDDDMTYIDIDGVSTQVCINCANLHG